MYRIELSPGEETAFRTIEELAVAIRRKVVTSRARIYHNATSKWLPIQFHPHYKIACSMPLTQADLVAGPPSAQRSTLKLDDQQAEASFAPLTAPSNRQAATQAALSAWPEPKPSAPPVAASPVAAAPVVREMPKQAAPSVAPIQLGTPAPEPRLAPEPRRVEPSRALAPRPLVEPRRILEPVRAAPPQRAPEPRLIEPRATEPTTGKRSRRRKSQRTLRIALAAAVVIACAHLAVSGASSLGGAMAARPRTPRQLIEAPAQALKDLTPRTVGAVMPVLQSIPLPSLKPASSPEPVIKRAAITTTGFPRRAAVVTPAPAQVVVDSTPAPEIEAAPDAGVIGAPELPNAESLTPHVSDSAGKTTFKRMLRTIGGAPSTAGKPAKP
jgi:hypothetical protein